jgi:hypothetical protein
MLFLIERLKLTAMRICFPFRFDIISNAIKACSAISIDVILRNYTNENKKNRFLKIEYITLLKNIGVASTIWAAERGNASIRYVNARQAVKAISALASFSSARQSRNDG